MKNEHNMCSFFINTANYLCIYMCIYINIFVFISIHTLIYTDIYFNIQTHIINTDDNKYNKQIYIEIAEYKPAPSPLF